MELSDKQVRELHRILKAHSFHIPVYLSCRVIPLSDADSIVRSILMADQLSDEDLDMMHEKTESMMEVNYA